MVVPSGLLELPGQWKFSKLMDFVAVDVLLRQLALYYRLVSIRRRVVDYLIMV